MDRFLFQPLEYQQQQPPPIEEILSVPIVLSDRIRRAVTDSKSHKLECNDVGKKVHRLSEMLRSTVRYASSTPSFYEPPVRRIFTDIAVNLNRTLTTVRKCRHRSIFRRFVSNVGITDFRKLYDVLDVSISDMRWLHGIFDCVGDSDFKGGIVLSLPPIASTDPILAWIWSNIASLHLCPLNTKIEVAHELSTIAQDTDRNKNIIAQEGGIPPLLKLLKDDSSPDAQIAAAIALFNLSNNQNRSRLIFNEHGVPIIAHVFRNSQIPVQIEVAKLIATMSQHDTFSQEGFGRENVIATLIRLLSFDKKQLSLELKTNCSGALWMLARGSITNSKKIIEAKGLLCLSKLIEKEKGEIQINCLMTVMEMTGVLELNPDIRRKSFKANSPIVEQILRLINQSDNPVIIIPAIRTIGYLARTFPATQTHVINLLVKQLGNRNPDVGMESVIALGKFTCPDNFLCEEHSRTIFEFEGVRPLLRLLRGNERLQYHALVLVCYLAMHCKNSEAFEQAMILTALEGANTSFACRYSELRELVNQAIYHLKIACSR